MIKILKNLKNYDGTSSLGGHTIPICSSCGKQNTSTNKMATNDVDNKLGIDTVNESNGGGGFDDKT